MTTAKKDGDFRQGAMVAAVSDAENASRYLESLENLCARQKGVSVEENRPSIAHDLSTSVSGVDFIRRQRRKVVPSWLLDRIMSRFIVAAQNEIRALEHEIAVAKQVGLDPRDGALIKTRARAASLVKLLEETVGPG